MSGVAIRIENLSKLYRIGQREPYRTLCDTLTQAFTAPFRRIKQISNSDGRKPNSDFIWALKNISLDIKHGEVIGIIGRNGAGKSTLLKILSRITEPTEGYAEIHGRVGSLLEVGTGFHPELTGRENIYLNGAILGMRKAEIERKFDEIVAFAEVEKFIDTPVKHYSSGMYVRLAFAVAAHLEPEILLVDEVLAVGDVGFQKKCLGKMGEVAKQGRTVLFVSHNLQAVSTLTGNCFVLNNGYLSFSGDTYFALRHYRGIWNNTNEGAYIENGKSTGLVRAKVNTSEPNNIHRWGEPLIFEFEIGFDKKPKSGAFSFQIVDEQARPVVHLWLYDSENPWSRAGKVSLRCILKNPKIYMGRYHLITHLADRSLMEKMETLEGICSFEIIMEGIQREYGWFPGACTYLEDPSWEVA